MPRVTLKRPYPLPHETWEEREMEVFAAPCRWEDVETVSGKERIQSFCPKPDERDPDDSWARR